MTPEDLIILISRDESTKLEFKQEYNLDKNRENQNNIQKWNEYIDGQWDELIRDLLSIINGNIGVPNEMGYLIIGVDDKRNVDGTRNTYDMKNIAISETQILSKINDSCYPQIPSLSIERVNFEGKTIIVIILPPSPYIHETNRQLNVSRGKFKSDQLVECITKNYTEYTAFIRKGEAIYPASWVERLELHNDKQFSNLLIKENVKREIVNNLCNMLFKISGNLVDPCLLIDNLKSKYILEWDKSIEIDSKYFYTVTTLILPAASTYKKISTQFLDDAIISKYRVRYDVKNGTLLDDPFYKYLERLQQSISIYKNSCELTEKSAYEFIYKYNPKYYSTPKYEIVCNELIWVMGILFKYEDVIKLSKAILSNILNPNLGFSEVILNPPTPMESEIRHMEEEKVSEDEVIDWCKK
jgi:predicted HTH transcriptional regulator